MKGKLGRMQWNKRDSATGKNGYLLPRMRDGISPVHMLHNRYGRKQIAMAVAVVVLLVWWLVYASIWPSVGGLGEVFEVDAAPTTYSTEEILNNANIRLLANSTLDFGRIFVIIWSSEKTDEMI